MCCVVDCLLHWFCFRLWGVMTKFAFVFWWLMFMAQFVLDSVFFYVFIAVFCQLQKLIVMLLLLVCFSCFDCCLSRVLSVILFVCLLYFSWLLSVYVLSCLVYG